MKIPRFSNAIGNLDEDLVEAAAECKKKQNHLLKLGSIAACFAVIIVVGALVLPSLLGGEPTPGGTNDRYKDMRIITSGGNMSLVLNKSWGFKGWKDTRSMSWIRILRWRRGRFGLRPV